MKILTISLLALATAACSNDDGDPGPPSGHPSRAGKITVQKWSSGRVKASALFSGPAPAGQGDPCTTSQVGPCSIVVCTDPPDDAPDVVLARAGTLTINGGSTPIMMEPSVIHHNQYEVTDGSLATFAAGEALSISATGEEVPPFSARSARMPADIQVTPLPELIDFGKDLDVAWTGGGRDGAVVVELLSDDRAFTGSLSCSFTPTDHHGTVPKAALAVLPACGVHGTACAWTVSPKDVLSFGDGDFAIDFTAVAGGMAGMYENPDSSNP